MPTTTSFTPDEWWWQALQSPLSLRCLLTMALCVAGLALCARVMGRVQGRGRRRPTLRALHRDTSGTAVMEFALVFPIGMFMILALAQTTFLMGGNLFVHYSAFAATRAAIVQIPLDYAQVSNEPPNTVVNEAAVSPKTEAIRQAAVFAVMPVCGQLDDANFPTGQFTDGLSAVFRAYNRSVPGWVNNGLAADRLRYAYANTSVKLAECRIDPDPPHSATFHELPTAAPYTFGPKDPITARVTHSFYLSIPYVRVLFADGTLAPNQGRGRYAQISAQYTMINEGISTALPPPTPVPRRP